jgi:hypothetical protein
MDPQIVENHALTSRAAVRFLDYAVAEGKCLDRLNLLDASLPGFAGEYEFPLHSWPWFISEETRQMLQESVCRIPELILRAVRAEFAGDMARFASFYRLPGLLSVIFMESGMDLSQLILRVDAMLTAGGLKIMEMNAGPNVGGWQTQWIEPQYRKHAALAPFLASTGTRLTNIPLEYMKHLVRQGLACVDGPDDPVNVLFIVGVESLPQALELSLRQVFNEALRSLEVMGDIFFEADYSEVRFDSQNATALRGQRIATLASYGLEHITPAPVDLYRSFLSRKVAWLSNPFNSIIGDKRSLAITFGHMDSGLFTDEERRLIESYIPWSALTTNRKVSHEGAETDLETLLIERQRDFVIKPARSFGGAGVVVGRFQTAQSWREAVEQAFLDDRWLVQEYCESLPFYGQAGDRGYAVHDVVWGVFGFGLRYGGCWLRLSPKDGGDGVINSARGAMETVVYEVDE